MKLKLRNSGLIELPYRALLHEHYLERPRVNRALLFQNPTSAILRIDKDLNALAIALLI